MADDLYATVAELQAKGVTFTRPITDATPGPRSVWGDAKLRSCGASFRLTRCSQQHSDGSGQLAEPLLGLSALIRRGRSPQSLGVWDAEKSGEAFEVSGVARDSGLRPEPVRRHDVLARLLAGSASESPTPRLPSAVTWSQTHGRVANPARPGLWWQRAQAAARGKGFGVIANPEQAAGQLLAAVEQIIERA
jgi:hypothetical protein